MKKLFSLLTICVILILIGCSKDQDTLNPSQTKIKIVNNLLNISEEKKTENIFFSSEANWIAKSEVDWINIIPLTGTAGKNLSLTLKISENNLNESRIGIVVVKELNGYNSDTIRIKQTGRSPFVRINWEETSITTLDLVTGNVVLNFKDNVPNVVDGKSVLVLETDTSSHIRRVIKSSVNGNSITMKTIEGDMTDIFFDDDFTLSFEPLSEQSINKSGLNVSGNAKGIIHPVKIIQKTENGYITDYDINNKTKAYSTHAFPPLIWDNSGKVIPGGTDGNSQIYWKKNELNIQFGAQCNIKFKKSVTEKEITKDLKVKVGELEEFSFLLEGKANWDLIIGALMKGEFKFNKSEISIMKNILPKKTFKFMVGPPPGIPVFISLQSDFLADILFEGEATVEVSGGVSFGGRVEAGIKYTKNTDWNPIASANMEFNIHPIALATSGRLNTKISAYPKLNILFYDLIGPTIALKPYLRDEIKAGSFDQLGSSSKDYYALTEKIYAGLDFNLDIDLNFIGKKKRLELPRKTLYGGLFFNSPDKIKLKKPSGNDKIVVNTPIDVTFNVTCLLLKESRPQRAVSVKFESQKGDVDKDFGITNDDGDVSVKWTPKQPDAFLTAKVYNDEMKIISEARIPNKGDFSIVGKWLGPETSTPSIGLYYKDIYTFNSDGTYYIDKNSERLHHKYGVYPNMKYDILDYDIIKGTYQYDKENNILTTRCTSYIHYHEEKRTITLDGKTETININNETPREDSNGKDYYGGFVEVVNETEFIIIKNGVGWGYNKIP